MPCGDYNAPSKDMDVQDNDYRTITRLACDRCKHLESINESIPLWAIDWWKRHKQEDEDRCKT